MLFKRGSTISAAEGGCQAEVGGEFGKGVLIGQDRSFTIFHTLKLPARWPVLGLQPAWVVRSCPFELTLNLADTDV